MIRTVRTALLTVAAALVVGVAAPPVAARPTQDPAATTTTAATSTTTVPATADDGATAGATAIDDLAACIQGSRSLAVVFLIDESGSLQTSDPDNLRVDAAEAALDSLTSLTQGPKAGRIQLDVTFAAFSNRYRTVQDWTAVSDTTTPTLIKTLESYRKLNQGTDTDFVNALTGARAALADRSAALTADGGDAPCKAVLLFTDGKYDIGVRTPDDIDELGATKPYAPDITLDSEANAAKAEAAGRAALCDQGGLADGVRGDSITLLTVALTGRVDPEAQKFLEAFSTGSAEGTTCGKPVERAAGAFVSASDVDRLVARFDEVAVRVAGGTLVPGAAVTMCGKDPCPNGTRSLTVDASVRRLRILALAPKPGLAVRLTGPGGEVTVDKAGDVSLGAAKGTARTIAGRGLVVEVDRPDDADSWTGEWTVTLLDPTGKQEGKPATLNTYLYSDLKVAFTGKPALTRGEAQPITAAPVLPEGVEADLVDATVVVRIDDPIKGTTRRVALDGPPNGPYAGDVEVPTSYTSNYAEASVELEGTTSSGARITARSAPEQVLVERPGEAIQFAPAVIALPSITGEGSSSAPLLLVGGQSAGCVWFGKATSDAPDGAGEIKVRYDGKDVVGQGNCIEVAGGKASQVVIEVQPSGRASGTANGILEVHEQVQGGKASVTQVPYHVDLALGIDETRRLFLAIVLVAVGIALPLALLYLVNVLSARFQSLDAVRGAVIPVRVDGRMLYRTDGARLRPLSVTADDFESMVGTGGPRRFAFGGVEFRAKASRNPFGAAMAMAAPEGGAERLDGKAGSKIELDTALAGSWIFLLDPDRTRRGGPTESVGRLVAFVAEGDATPQLRRMVPEVEEQLPTTASRLAALVRGKATREANEEASTTAKGRGKAPKAKRGAAPEPVDAPETAPVVEAPEPVVEPPVDEAPVVEAPVVEDSSDDPPVVEASSDEPDDEPPPPPLGFTGRG